jgi:hypothetical protein
MKKDRIRNATSTKGVISVAVLLRGILTLGICCYKRFVLRHNYCPDSIIECALIYIKRQKIVLR